MVTIFFYWRIVSKLKALKVASDVSTIHPTSRRNNGLVSETRLSTPFNKILATPLYPGPYTHAVCASFQGGIRAWYPLSYACARFSQKICEIVNYSITLRILLHPLRHYYWVELTVVSWILYCKCGCCYDGCCQRFFLWKRL